ncbi:hypothetical protein DPEC_G00185160 [Dallia pectoralis]|uniref:Uncharacterized protein n=1 Tax=Dallia pectoralis TaxID=75939 RepID=A0ACC2GBH1_DALPE|nr:hypothetical protein DPEC_G00185160 [Dallia pectoralis]
MLVKNRGRHQRFCRNRIKTEPVVWICNYSQTAVIHRPCQTVLNPDKDLQPHRRVVKTGNPPRGKPVGYKRYKLAFGFANCHPRHTHANNERLRQTLT